MSQTTAQASSRAIVKSSSLRVCKPASAGEVDVDRAASMVALNCARPDPESVAVN